MLGICFVNVLTYVIDLDLIAVILLSQSALLSATRNGFKTVLPDSSSADENQTMLLSI